MSRYHNFKNAIIATLAAAFYCYSCMQVPDNKPASIAFATIGIGFCIYAMMFELDCLVISKRRRRYY